MKFAKELTERFLRYVAIPSESNARAGVVPSSEGQRELARLLEAELRETKRANEILKDALGFFAESRKK